MPGILAWMAASALPLSVSAQQSQGLVFNGELMLQSDSNVLRQKEAEADKAAIFSPEVVYRNDFSKHRIVMTYDGTLAEYMNNERWSYGSHELGATASFTHTYPFSSELAVGYQDTIEQPGLINSATGLRDRLNRLNQANVLARFNTGTLQSTGQIVLALEHEERNFTNNAQEFRDVDRDALTGTFFYRTGPRLRLLLETTSTSYDYPPDRSSRNQSSREMRYLTGAEWAATAKTTGIARIGYQSKDFDNADFDDISGLSYALDMIWQPTTYTKVTLRADRRTNESAQLGVAGFMSTAYALGVEHMLTPRTTLGVNYSRGIHYIRGLHSREDKRRELNLALDYQLSGWLYLGFEYRHEEGDSISPFYQFNSNRLGVSLSTRFE